MSFQSLQELFAPEDFHVFDHDIMGFDVGDVERRASAEKVQAWHVFSAAWSIVWTRHTSQNSLDFLATDVSMQKTANGWVSSSSTSVHASVDEESTFSELLHKAIEFSVPTDQLARIPSSSAVVIYPFTGSSGSQELPRPPSTQSAVTVQLFSKGRKRIQTRCRYHNQLPGHFVEKVMQHFLHLLRNITNHASWSSLRITDISMISLQEEMQLRHDCLPPRNLAEMEVGSVHQLFRRQAQKTPNNPALEGIGGKVLSYLELDLMSDLMAEDLHQRLFNISPPQLDTGLAVNSVVVVGIMLQRSTSIVIAILSCWKAGYGVVLVDPSQPDSRNRYIIEDCRCPLLIVDESWDGFVGKEVAWRFNFNALRYRANITDDNKMYRTSEPDLSKDLFGPAWIRVTSGSTGRPKCTLHNHAAFGSSIASYSGRIRASKTLLFFNPISSASGIPIWTFLTNGGCVCIPSQQEISSDLAGCINRYNIDDICITPSALSLISPEQVPALKSISLAGEATPRCVAETWSQHVSLLIGYGATEMNSHSLPFHDELTGALPPAHALPNSDYSLYILRPGTNDLCPLYVPGEICLSSTYMSSGYINMPEATSKVFVRHPFPGDAGHAYLYRTGDLGMFIGTRRFVVLGRIDFQFKIDGNRIQPEEVESIINQIPQVLRSKVILVQPSVGRPVATCCVILKETLANGLDPHSRWNNFISTAEKACASHLPAYMMPQRWLQFDKFPETPTAKTDGKALAIEAKNIIDNEGVSVFSDNYNDKHAQISKKGKLFLDLALEILTGYGADALPLQVRQKMQAQSFISNGGTSLLSLQLRSLLRQSGIEIPLSQLYTPQTLIDMALTFPAAEGEADKIEEKMAEFLSSVTEDLLPRISAGVRPDLEGYEAVFPTTMLQREMFVTSVLDPRMWMFYQFFDLSQVNCTISQLHAAISLLASAKRNLRTVFSLVDAPTLAMTVEDPDTAFNLIRDGKLVQAILKPSVMCAEFSQEDEIEEPEEFWKADVNKKWSLTRPLWRVTFLSKPRLLAWTFHHSIVDAWVARNISRDLYAILLAVVQRDNCQQGWKQALTSACVSATKPSIEQWVIKHYGINGLDGSPTPVIQKHQQIWEDFMANVTPTPIPDRLKLPDDALPALPLMEIITSLPYGDWCRRHHVTAAALFHAVGALTIARLLNWWRPEGPQQPTEEVTYYRLSANRATVQGALDMEGALISISPMRVRVAADSDAVAISHCALENWLATQESDPYYLDGQLTPTGPDPMARQRRWGNILLNHIVDYGDVDPPPSFPGAIDDKCGFAMVWPFAALELTLVETDPQANSLHLSVLSTLERESTEEFMGIFVHILRLVVDKDSKIVASEILQQL